MKEFIVTEVFNLSGGQTVFAGTTADPEQIGSCLARLVVGGGSPIEITVEGEYILLPNKTKQRAVSTRSAIPLPVNQLRIEKCIILFG
jgi:hypothetical protein